MSNPEPQEDALFGQIALANKLLPRPAVEECLKEGGITAVEPLAEASVEQLTAIKGIGEKTAQKLIEAAKAALSASRPVPAREQPSQAPGAQAAAPARAEPGDTDALPTPPVPPPGEEADGAAQEDSAHPEGSAEAEGPA